VAHADPAAELPAVLSLLDARFHVRSARGARVIAAEDFFLTYFTTALEADELLVEIEVPPVDRGTGHAFVEFARRDGDFALGGAGALVRRDGRGGCREAALVLLGAATPWRPRGVEAALVGSPLDNAAIAEAAHAAVRDFGPSGDIHGSAEYRKSLARTMVRRALSAAANSNSQVPLREGASHEPE
jgi:CO/xanthine dehydrogenase FAD-binding subunit